MSVAYCVAGRIYVRPQFVKLAQFGLEETCLARMAGMEIYGVDYPNSLSHSKCRVDVLKHKATRGLVGWGQKYHKKKGQLPHFLLKEVKLSMLLWYDNFGI